MNKVTKALAAIMLIVAAVIVAGCNKPDEPNEPNNGGNNGGGGNGDTPDGHEYVDLGLPSGTLWATCNVGADTPEGYGYYFAWGETHPQNGMYNWYSYNYCNANYHALTKYCTLAEYGYEGFIDNLTVLQSEDDAATANWGGSWYTPSKEQWEELYQNTTMTFAIQNEVRGMSFTASNGKSIFLPAAGYYWDSELNVLGNYGIYWSSSLNTDGNPNGAWGFYFATSTSVDDFMDSFGRARGQSVRPVRFAE